jgi:hypothetical protein
MKKFIEGFYHSCGAKNMKRIGIANRVLIGIMISKRIMDRFSKD